MQVYTRNKGIYIYSFIKYKINMKYKIQKYANLNVQIYKLVSFHNSYKSTTIKFGMEIQLNFEQYFFYMQSKYLQNIKINNFKFN